MNVKLHKIAICMSRFAIYAMIVCQSLIMTMASGLEAQRRLLEEIPIVLKSSAPSRDLIEVITEIESKGDFTFAYSKRDVRGKTIELNENSWNMESLLKEISLQGRFSIRRVNETISLNPVGNQELPDVDEKLIVQESISGKITDEDGEGLPGASVLEKGTTNGTITDIEGNFSLNVSDNAVLTISFVGYEPREVSTNGQSQINVQLIEDISALEEVVVVGYGTQKRKDVTGAISTVDFEDEALSSRALTNVSTMLVGMSSGIRVQQTNGLPSDNNNASITVRGVGSLNTSSAPLVIIDGQKADINSVSPNDVASVSVLKDAASAAIYGSRASNGVILITTKTGKNAGGKVTFNYNNYYGVKTAAQEENMVSSSVDYMRLVNRMLVNDGLAEKYSEAYQQEWAEGSLTDPIAYPNTNWLDAITKDNMVMNHNFSARGGNEKVNFYTSMDYFKDDGLVSNTGFTRVNFRNNLSYNVNKWLKIGNNFTIIRTKAEPGTVLDAFQWLRATTPAVVPKHPDGRYGSGQLLGGEGGTNNGLRNIENARGEKKGTELQGKIYAVITPITGFSITTSYFTDFWMQEAWDGSISNDQWNFQTDQVGINRTTGFRQSLTNTYKRNQRQIFDLFADYTKSFGNHNFSVLVGYNQEYYNETNFRATIQDLLSYDTPVLDAAQNDPQVGGNGSDYALRSFFGRLSYNFKGKYLFETNLRYDGSSRFAPDQRWGLFPSASVGWMLSEEEFWSPLKGVVNSFKLRGSYGQLGNNGIGNYEWQQFYQAANYNFDGNVVSGLTYSAFGNPLITWETTNVTNIGADFKLFNTLSFDINYYDKVTKDILARIPIPWVSGGVDEPRVNAAEVQNKGFEVESRYLLSLGKVTMNFALNFGYNKNKILKYKEDGFIDPRGNYNAWTVGQPIDVFWIREVDHIVQDQAEVDALVTDGYTFNPSTPGVGDFLYKDNNGDKSIDEDDRVLKGNPIPLYTYGGNIGLTYAGFDFNVYFDGVGSWDRYIFNSLFALQHQQGYQWPKEYLDGWTAENPSTEIPKIYQNNPKNNQYSDYFMRKADYLKIRSIQVGYNLPTKLIQSINIEKIRVFVNMENYFTFTKWPTNNPEVTLPPEGGDQTYPLSRTFSAGLSISF